MNITYESQYAVALQQEIVTRGTRKHGFWLYRLAQLEKLMAAAR